MTPLHHHSLRVLRALAFGLACASGLAFAANNESEMPHGKRCDEAMHQGHHGAMTPEKMHAMMEHRMQRLHDQLALTAAQEPAWTEFHTQMKPADEMPRPNIEAIEKLPAPERMARKLAMMKTHQAWMESRIPIVTAFYQKLTSAQQKTFDHDFMHFGGGHHGQHGMRCKHAV